MKVDSLLRAYCGFHSISSQFVEMVEPFHLGEAEVVSSPSELPIYAKIL